MAFVAGHSRAHGGERMRTRERVQSTMGVQDYARTGSDRSAGRTTRAAALFVTALLLPGALFRRGLRSVAGGLRRPGSAVAEAVRLLCRALTGAVRRAWAGLIVVARGPQAALIAVVRRCRAGLIAVWRRVGAALVAVVRWAETASVWSWRALTPVGRILVAGLLTLTALLSRRAGMVARLLFRCARPLGVLLCGACLAVWWAISVLRTVGWALVRVLAKLLRGATTVARIVFSPCLLAGRAIVFLARRLGRRTAVVLRLAGSRSLSGASWQWFLPPLAGWPLASRSPPSGQPVVCCGRCGGRSCGLRRSWLRQRTGGSRRSGARSSG
jgi:hypothetical protein